MFTVTFLHYNLLLQKTLSFFHFLSPSAAAFMTDSTLFPSFLPLNTKWVCCSYYLRLFDEVKGIDECVAPNSDCNISMHGVSWSRSGQHVLRMIIIFCGGFVWLLVSLQRPVRWTTVAATARVTTRWQESAAAVQLALLCSRTGRPVKVKEKNTLHSSGLNTACTCCEINSLLVV